MRLDQRRVLLQTVVQLTQGRVHVVRQPLGFREKELSVCETAILLGYVL
jgi:hypothetical protein